MRINIPLNIPSLQVKNFTIDKEDNIFIKVVSQIKGTNCSKCGKRLKESNFHCLDREIQLRHLSILDHETYLLIRPKRYRCPYCDNHPTTTQKVPWYTQNSSCTKAYEDYTLLSLVNSTIKDVSQKNNISYDLVRGIIKRNLDTKIDWNLVDNFDYLGIDEVSLRKGHKDFVTIITAKNTSKTTVLGVLPDRKKVTVKKFLEDIPEDIRLCIKGVCTDMYDGFVNSSKEVFGDNIVIIDRFHVAKLYRGKVDNIRKNELRRLKKELSKERYSKLKGSMWIIRKKNKNLTKEERKTLRLLFSYSPKLKKAYKLSNELTRIFNKKITKKKALKLIKKWKKKVKKHKLEEFYTFLETYDKYSEEITNYFNERQTSGFVEGLNNKIKVIKRRCYGITNPEVLFQRIYLDTRGYSFAV